MAKTIDILNTVSGINGEELFVVRKVATDNKVALSAIKTFIGEDFTVTKILPEMTGAVGSISVRDIGDSTHRFANVWADEVHVGASSLYVNGKKVIEDNSNIMTFATDPDQGVNLKTVSSVPGTGNGNLQLTSDNQIGVTAKGGIDLTVPSNVASKHISFTNSSTNGSIILNAASQIQFTAPTVSTGNLTVTGDLVVNGTTTSINTTELLIQDNIVVLNKNQTGTPSTTLVSGLDVERGDQSNYRFAFEELTDTFKIGMVGQLQPVATREDTPISGGVALWDATNNRFNTQTVATAFNKEFGTTAGTISEGNHTHSYQPLDADLTSIAGLVGTTGLLKKTAANTWSLDTSAYLTGITKAQIEAQLTGEITTHTHSSSSIQTAVQGMNFTIAPTISSRRIVTVASGTTFPGSAGLGDECYRTDLDEWYKYNGAVWMQI